jgi:DNA recombination protein RmuC
MLAVTLQPNILTVVLAGIAALFALLAFLRVGRKQSDNQLSIDQMSRLLLDESNRTRRSGDEEARALRQELSDNFKGFEETALKVFRELRMALETKVTELGERLDKGVMTIDDRAAAIGTKLDQDMGRMGEEANRNRDALRQAVEVKLDRAATIQSTAAKGHREELTDSFSKLGATLSGTLTDLGRHHKERLENVTKALSSLSERHERSQEALRQTVEGRLDAIRNENAAKLDEMRKTVDEKLQLTLETRLSESFDRVVEQLERVHKGIGEMQSLAAGVGDLKRILSNVRIRGTFGEVQLGMLLEQFLSPEQFTRNAQIKEDSQERVEFAIKLPGRGSAGEVLLPVDAKFPHEDYERLITASEAGDAEAVAQAGKELENRIRHCARTIREKYIATPRTTDFGILFLPTESLFAEVLRRPGFFEQLQNEYHVTLTGPTTFTALLNALQMGFRSLAIEKRSSEVWQILGAVKNEFGKYGVVVDSLSRQLNTAAKSVESLGVRTRAMSRKLRDVEKLPDDAAQIILGPAFDVANEDEEALKEVQP